MTITQSSPPPAATVTTSEVDSCIHFPEGLVGCSSWKSFVLLTETDQDLPVAVLKSVDEAGVSLLVTDPSIVVSEYDAQLSAADRSELDLAPDQQPVLYCTLTISRDGAITANLLGPLAINGQTRRGKQLVLADSGYSAQHPVGVLEGESCSS